MPFWNITNSRTSALIQFVFRLFAKFLILQNIYELWAWNDISKFWPFSFNFSRLMFSLLATKIDCLILKLRVFFPFFLVNELRKPTKRKARLGGLYKQLPVNWRDIVGERGREACGSVSTESAHLWERVTWQEQFMNTLRFERNKCLLISFSVLGYGGCKLTANCSVSRLPPPAWGSEIPGNEQLDGAMTASFQS